MSEPLLVGSLFAGIGGIDLGLERTGGFRTAWFSEVDPYASAVLARHWPDVPNLGDVRTIGGDAPRVDVLAGGFPCQDISSLGGKAGIGGAKSGLWSEFSRLIGELRPRIVFVENVAALRFRGLDVVLGDLSALGYDAEWDIVSARELGAPIRGQGRARMFLVAYPNSGRCGGPGLPREALGKALARPTGGRCSISRLPGSASNHWAVEPGMGRVVDGVSGTVDGARRHRLRALGNGVVPQVAEYVGQLILDAVRDGRA